MNRIGFDNDKYVKLQSQRIRDRIEQFGGKLYLEFGGKLFDDYHASRVLPGFAPDSKVKMLLEMRDVAEILIAISADDIERSKRRGDLGITYDDDCLRLIDAFRGIGLYIGSVVLTHYRGQAAADKFIQRLNTLGIRVYKHYIIPEYPSNVSLIVSDEGFGKNEYVETTRPLVVVTAPGPAAARWPPVSASSTTSTSAAFRPVMPSSRPSRCGTCRSSTRSTWPTRPRRPIWTMST